MADLTITGTHATYTIDGAPVTPFAGVTVTDPNVGALEKLSIFALGLGNSATLTYSAGYSGPRTLTSPYPGDYQLAGTAAQVSQELDQLVFTASAVAPGDSQTTSITLEDFSSATNYNYGQGGYASDNSTKVIKSTPKDTVSISPQVSFKNGVFTLTGTASSTVGVDHIDIQAMVDGVPTDLGTTTVDANGNFTFADRIGRHLQSYVTAIEIDSIDYSPARDTAQFSLAGGLHDGAVKAEQDGYTPDGSAVAFVSHFQPDGVHTTDISAPGQTLSADYTDTFNDNYQGNNTFVYNSGHGSNVVSEFLLRSAQHDTLSFSSADFNNSIASVLAHSYGPGDGSGVIIVDPTTQDTVQLAGITKRGLIEHRGDISFHG